MLMTSIVLNIITLYMKLKIFFKNNFFTLNKKLFEIIFYIHFLFLFFVIYYYRKTLILLVTV